MSASFSSYGEINPHAYDKTYLTKIRFICFYYLKLPHIRTIPSLSILEKHEFLKLFREYLLKTSEEIDNMFELISSEMFDQMDQAMNLKNKEIIGVQEGRKVAPPWFAMPSYEFGELKPSVLDQRIDQSYRALLEEQAVRALSDLGDNDD
jgi:hypothetical protein